MTAGGDLMHVTNAAWHLQIAKDKHSMLHPEDQRTMRQVCCAVCITSLACK